LDLEAREIPVPDVVFLLFVTGGSVVVDPDGMPEDRMAGGAFKFQEVRCPVDRFDHLASPAVEDLAFGIFYQRPGPEGNAFPEQSWETAGRGERRPGGDVPREEPGIRDGRGSEARGRPPFVAGRQLMIWKAKTV
jgi:hypothetical protein